MPAAQAQFDSALMLCDSIEPEICGLCGEEGYGICISIEEKSAMICSDCLDRLNQYGVKHFAD